MPKRIAIVGNAPIEDDRSSLIDGADHVVRFNNAFGYGHVTGARIDDLYLINCGGQPLEWLRSDAFWSRDYLTKTLQITLPLAAPNRQRSLGVADDGDGQSVDGLNFEWDMRAALRPLGKTVRTLAPDTISAATDALRALGAGDAQVNPSTGYLAAFAYLESCTHGTIVDLYGFTFAGWGGHSWESEKAWVLDQQSEGRLNWHQP
ncbi:glycosyltransferase family 29 protein [Hasllibacter sp. MH4015]|uniref:glycosyltransferase family 29 protein n=1 Tax=Hasllibacter sp. MH4015 TaxID=2854029 RepID=UPI001CD2F0F5|nr:glycosyltransferase family 29 protein [Hasllibacter sp. MH4015]